MLKLKKGDTVGIASPSHIATPQAYAPVYEGLQKMGLNVKIAPHLYAHGWGYAASDTERADDINTLVRDDDVDMIFFGGGEGADEILNLIDYDAVRAHPKMWLSFSDGTSVLNAVQNHTGLIVLYGQTPWHCLEEQGYNRDMFNRFVFEGGAPRHIPNTAWRTIRPGCAEGTLTGGYLDNYVYLALSGWVEPEPGRDYILILEDHEQFFGIEHVSDLLSRLCSAPIMRQVRGILFGCYSDEEKPYLDQCLARLGERLNIPVAACRDFGHGRYAAIFPLGERAVLDTVHLTMEYPDYIKEGTVMP